MRFLICFLLAAFLGLGTAAAAERTLLAQPGLRSTLGATPAAAKAIEALRQKAGKAGKLRVIVGLRVPFAAEGRLPTGERVAQRRDITSAASALRRRFATAIARDPLAVRSYSALPFMAMEVTPDELQRLAADPAVISLSEDRPNRVNLAQSVPLIGAPQSWSAGYTGEGQTVAIIDTGVDKTHPFLAGKVVAEACFARPCPGQSTASTAPGSGMPCIGPRDCQHGTHVAGIVAGRNGSSGGERFDGVAKDATLISVMVFSKAAGGLVAWDSDIIAGLQHVYDLRSRFRIAAVNMSLGGASFANSCDDYSPAMTTAIANLRSAGIATVVASGNDGNTGAISFPACISSAVSVGSVWDVAGWTMFPCRRQTSAVDKVACYSNTADILNLLAPGSAITSSIPGGRYAKWHGTSMAAPHVAAAWALLKEKAPDATVDQALEALETTGTPIADSRQPSIVKPRINIDKALERFVVLTLTAEGEGLGTFSIDTARGLVTCLAQCSVSVPIGEDVTVTAIPAPASQFSAWQGTCAGSGASCTLTMSEPRSAGAQFTGTRSSLAYVKLPAGSAPGGTVTITTTTGVHACDSDCTVPVAPSTPVSVTAAAGTDAKFTGWSGVCDGTGSCSYQQHDSAEPMSLTAGFATAYTLSYNKAGRGTGSVTLSTPGSSCSGSCSQIYDPGTVVTMSAVPAVGARFRSWSGACRGRGTCTITMSQSQSVTATFTGR